MAVSIDWPNRIIHVPRADLSLIQLMPTEIREMDLNWFRIQLKALEADAIGMPFPDTHRHNTEVSLSGLTFARVIEIINGYTVTFEDGQYAVNLVGANSNVGDRVNVNQVSVRSSNSAGLISSPEIQFSTFAGAVHVDTTSGNSGTVFPLGTPLKPVNNLDDALVIAKYRGLYVVRTYAALLIESHHNLDDMAVESANWLDVTVGAGASLVNTEFEKVSLHGVMGGYWNVLIDCWIYEITNFCGWVRGGSFERIELGPFTIANAGQSYFDAVDPMYPGVKEIVVASAGAVISITRCRSVIEIQSLVAGCTLVCGLQEGTLILDASCTGGTVAVAGVGLLVNNSTLSVFSDGLVNSSSVGGGGSSLTPQQVRDAMKLAASPGSPTVGSLDDLMATLPTEVWRLAIEDGYTAADLFRLLVATAAGQATGGGSPGITFKSLDGIKTRFKLNLLDVDGNRNKTDVVDLS